MKKCYSLIPGQGDQESRLYIDGEITAGEDGRDWWTGEKTKGANQFRQELSRCGPVTVYINSPGGDVFAGAEMYSALMEHPSKVTVKIMGIAASAASLVAMAGDEVLISPVGYLMIHDPWSFVMGNAREMEHEAQILREIGESIAQAYQKKTGLTLEEIKDLLAAETYMNAQSAIEHGFCDGLWEEDRSAFSEATAPAALMSGRNYTPQAYMARMRQAHAEREFQRLNQGANPLRVCDAAEKTPHGEAARAAKGENARIIAQALALVRMTTQNLKGD